MLKFKKGLVSFFTVVFLLQVICAVPVVAADDAPYITYIESYEGGAKVYKEASTDSKTTAKIAYGGMIKARKLAANPSWAEIKPTKTKSGKAISGYIFLEQFEVVRAKTQTDKTDLKSVLNATPLYPDCFFELQYDPYWREDLSILLISSSPWTIDEYDAKIKEMLEEITDGKETTYDKVKAIYDYIINNTSYDYGGYGCALSVYSVFEDGIGTCQDYNYVFMTMLRYLGLDARLAEGATAASGGGWTGHVWVEVYINDEIYTFDPQVEDNIAGRNSGKIQYQRFGKTYAEVPGKFDKWNTRARQMFDPESLAELDIVM